VHAKEGMEEAAFRGHNHRLRPYQHPLPSPDQKPSWSPNPRALPFQCRHPLLKQRRHGHQNWTFLCSRERLPQRTPEAVAEGRVAAPEGGATQWQQAGVRGQGPAAESGPASGFTCTTARLLCSRSRSQIVKGSHQIYLTRQIFLTSAVTVLR